MFVEMLRMQPEAPAVRYSQHLDGIRKWGVAVVDVLLKGSDC